MVWRIAWRNLWRNRTRTVIMASVVALSYALLLIAMGMGDDAHEQMLEAAAEGAGGEVLVHGAGYWSTRASDIVVPEADAVLRAVESVDGVRAAMPRVVVDGLASTSAGNRPVQLLGVRPERERALRDLRDDVVRGVPLEAAQRSDPLLLGARLVEDLELELGDRVVLTATGPDGELTRALFHLTGVLETGAAGMDEIIGYTTLEAARGAVGMDGMLTQIGLLAREDVAVAPLADRVRRALPGEAGELEVLTWREAVPGMVGFIEVDDAFLYVYMIVIFIVVAFAVANTFLMAVMERVREFGLLSALGLSGGRIGRLVVSETVLLAGLAMAAGFVVALAGHFAIAHWGIPMAAYGAEEIELAGIDMADMVMYSTIHPAKWLAASVLVALLTIGSSAYPAWRATRLAPAEAMRFYE